VIQNRREDHVKVRKFSRPIKRVVVCNRKSNFSDFEIRINFMTEPKIIHNQFYDVTKYYIEPILKSYLFIEPKN
jgi:hypothetical protein